MSTNNLGKWLLSLFMVSWYYYSLTLTEPKLGTLWKFKTTGRDDGRDNHCTAHHWMCVPKGGGFQYKLVSVPYFFKDNLVTLHTLVSPPSLFWWSSPFFSNNFLSATRGVVSLYNPLLRLKYSLNNFHNVRAYHLKCVRLN